MSASTYDPRINSSLLYDSSYRLDENFNSSHMIVQPDEHIDTLPASTDFLSSRFSSLIHSHHATSSDTLDLPCRSTYIRHPLARWVNYDNFTFDYKLFMTKFVKDIEPSSYKQASTSLTLVEAMNEKIATLHEFQTWELVPHPLDKNIVGTK